MRTCAGVSFCFASGSRHEIVWGANYRFTADSLDGQGAFVGALQPRTSRDTLLSAFAGARAFVWGGKSFLQGEDAGINRVHLFGRHQLFPFHTGFDFKSIREAVRHNEAQSNRKHPHIRGASTISQQVSKNLFLWSGGGYLRKGLEAYFTLLIELTWPKERILEVYLNVAQFGDGIYGVEAAAQRFWHKPAARLDRWEAATLAAVLPNPIRFRANAPSPYIQLRRDQILGQMRGLGGASYLDQLDNPTAPPKVRR